MKGYLFHAAFGLAALLFAVSAFGADYSAYSTEELSKMRGTLYNASTEEREAFRTEWQKRLQEMTPDQRRSYTGPPANAQAGNNNLGNRYRRGRAAGMGRCNRR